MAQESLYAAESHGTRAWTLFACLTILGLAFTSNIESASERAFLQEDDLVPVDFPVFYLGGKVALQRVATPLYYPPADRSQGYTLLYKYADDSTTWAQMGRRENLGKVMLFTNPPFSALLMAPFALLDWHSAYILWQVLILAFVAASIYFTLRLFALGPPLEVGAVVFVAACCFYPLRCNIVYGQVNATVLFLWTLGVYLLSRERAIGSALCFALGTVLKIFPIVAVPLLVLRRQWRWLAAYFAGVAGFTGISIGELGWGTNLTWLTKIYPAISSGVGNYINRSLAGLIDVICGPKYFASLNDATEWPIPYGLSIFEKVCSLAIGLAFLYWCWRKRRDAKGLVNELILLPLVYLLTAPFSWPHHYVLAILPLTYFWVKARASTIAELAALYLCTLALGTELPTYIGAYTSLGSPAFIVAAIAIWPAATCVLIWLGMRMYTRSLPLSQ
jgi:hypothetical protein